MKRVILAVITIVMAMSVVACTVTKTESYTDENGNTTTTTTVKDKNGTETTTEVVDANGNVMEEEIVEEEPSDVDAAEPMIEAPLIKATVVIDNQSGVDVTEMYFGLDCVQTEDWGDDILGDNAPLMDGENITYPDGLTYSEDYPFWDFLVYDENGDGIVFEDIDVTVGSDPNEIVIVLSYSDEDGFFVEVK